MEHTCYRLIRAKTILFSYKRKEQQIDLEKSDKRLGEGKRSSFTGIMFDQLKIKQQNKVQTANEIASKSAIITNELSRLK
jgi:exonuclease SbcC